jgi:hypothetical protein
MTLATGIPASALGEVVITHDGVGCVVAGSFPVVRARLEPPGEVAQARVYFQARGTPNWYYVAMEREGAAAFVATLPSPLHSLDGFDYYVEALGPGLALSRTPEYSARVITESRSCPSGLTLATVGGTVPSGLLVGAAEGAPGLPPGFSDLGLASKVSGGATSAAGIGAAGAGGTSTAVLVGIGAAAVAAGIGLAAAGGGDGGTEDAPTPTGPPPAMPEPTPAPPDATGRWAGRFVEDPSPSQCSVTSDLSLDLRQSGATVTGTFQLVIRSATPAPQDPCPVAPGDAFTGPVRGTVNGNSIRLELQITGGPTFVLAGTISGNRMGGTSPPDADGPGGSWELMRQ